LKNLALLLYMLLLEIIILKPVRFSVWKETDNQTGAKNFFTEKHVTVLCKSNANEICRNSSFVLVHDLPRKIERAKFEVATFWSNQTKKQDTKLEAANCYMTWTTANDIADQALVNKLNSIENRFNDASLISYFQLKSDYLTSNSLNTKPYESEDWSLNLVLAISSPPIER